MNHSALVTQGQLDEMRAALGVASGEEWAGFAPGSAEAELIRRAPAPYAPPAPRRDALDVPDALEESYPAHSSTQEAFGRVLGRLSRLPVGDRVVTFSADVSMTTHLAGWINRKGVYFPRAKPGFAAEGPQAVQWKESPAGQHIELGIAEHNLFLALGAFGLTHELSGTTLLPIGTLYDPFVTARARRALPRALRGRALHRGRDALGREPLARGRRAPVGDHAGHRHRAARHHLLRARLRAGGRVDPARRPARPPAAAETPRASTCVCPPSPSSRRSLPRRSPAYRDAVLRGGYRLIDARERPGYDREGDAVHIFAAGVMVPEAVAASRALAAEGVHANVFVVTSPDLLHRGLRTTDPYVLDLVSADEEGVPVVSVLDGHSHGLAFLGGALGVPQIPLGVDHFGQSGSRGDLYRHYGVDAAAIALAANRLLARGSGPG